MKRLLAIGIALAPTSSLAQALDFPPAMKEEIQKSAMRLAFADGCDKRLDRPEMYSEAKLSFARLLAKAKVPDPEAKAEEISKTIREKPQEKEASPFSLFNEKLCADVANAIKADLANE